MKQTIKRQIRKRKSLKMPKDEEEAGKMVTASHKIPLVDGLSQAISRIAHAAGVKCAFRTANNLRSAYSAKDSLPKQTCTQHCVLAYSH